MDDWTKTTHVLVLGPDLLALNPIPLAGQVMAHGQTGLRKMGDGVTPWSDLPPLQARAH